MDSSAGTFGCGHIGNGDSILEYATSASVRCAWDCSSIVALSTPGKRYAKAFPDSSERNCLMFCVRLSVIRSFNLWMAKIITSLYNCNSFIPARRDQPHKRLRPQNLHTVGEIQKRLLLLKIHADITLERYRSVRQSTPIRSATRPSSLKEHTLSSTDLEAHTAPERT